MGRRKQHNKTPMKRPVCVCVCVCGMLARVECVIGGVLACLVLPNIWKGQAQVECHNAPDLFAFLHFSNVLLFLISARALKGRFLSRNSESQIDVILALESGVESREWRAERAQSAVEWSKLWLLKKKNSDAPNLH